MICVAPHIVAAKASRMPASYLDECKAAALIRTADQFWCFAPSDFFRIRMKYRGFAVSEADRFQEGHIISGCCDRADQA